MNERKTNVVARVAAGRSCARRRAPTRQTPEESWFTIAGWVVHVRDVSNSKNDGKSYGFGIYPSTLEKAEYEVWICGSTDRYYIIPIAVLKELYADAYPDTSNPDHKVMSVDITTHICDARKIDLTPYYCAPLPDASAPILLDFNDP